MRAMLLLPSLAAAAAPTSLRAALQKVIDEQAAAAAVAGGVDGDHPEHPISLQFSWHDASEQFTVAAGSYPAVPGGPAARPATESDSFLYGSGTKTFTAAAVMALVEQGKVSLDDPLAKHVDPVLAKIAGTSLADLFGAGNASQMTVKMAIGMRAGIPDYDGDDGGVFDDNLLCNPAVNTKTHSPMEFIKATADQGMKCAPGTCYEYSSTSMILASFIILNHQEQWKGWSDLDQLHPFPAAVKARDMANTHFFSDQTISALLSGPGVSSPYNATIGGDPKKPMICAPGKRPFPASPDNEQLLWKQSGSILGLGCANMVSPTAGVAAMQWDMFGPTPTILSAASVAAMIAPLDHADPAAFGGGYGLGLQTGTVLNGREKKPTRGQWGTWIGHVGDVYGFASLQGWFYGANASFALATNFDDGWYTPASGFLQDTACRVLTAVAEAKGAQLSFKCH